MSKFNIQSSYRPAGDQPKAIEQLVSGLEQGMPRQTLLGVTGSGKTFTMGNVIERVQMPTLVIAHNKTLAAQLCNEFREFFPDNAVEYFVSYYDYYQPEAYIPHSDTYIEKEAQINQEIDRLRHACTQALLSRRDVIIVASVSAIYGLGSPTEYEKIVLHLKQGQRLDRRGLLEQLIEMQFERTNSDLKRGSFRLRGQVFEIMPVNEEVIYRLEISDVIERIEKLDPVTRAPKFSADPASATPPSPPLERGGSGLSPSARPLGPELKAEGDGVARLGRAGGVGATPSDIWLFPARHYVVGEAARESAFQSICAELEGQLKYLQDRGKVLEYERLKRRVKYDLEMIKNIGYCNGIENYSRHFEGRATGEPPFTLLDYFRHSASETSPPALSSAPFDYGPGRSGLVKRAKERGSLRPSFAKEGIEGRSRGFLTIIDESHVTVPQIRGMYFGDKARKDTLVEHGFRLPSARDNRPLAFEEFNDRVGSVVFVSATPAEYELGVSQQVVEQVVRPTGLVDPEVVVCPITGNIRTYETYENTKDTKSDINNLSQVEDLLVRIDGRLKQNERVLVTTLTKKMAEDLSEYLREKGVKVKYLHSDIQTLERIEIITDLRLGKIEVIVGVNLLREGLDLPEVSLVAVLDADKEGFLRSETSLIQTIGRAARNINGQVVLYADQITGSMERALKETNRRREIQLAYNKKHGITPKTIEKTIRNLLEDFGITRDVRTTKGTKIRKREPGQTVVDLDLLGDARKLPEIIKDKERQMKAAADQLEFELAAILRDEINELRLRLKKK